jgi:transcription initiation factor IIE alpha subunit
MSNPSRASRNRRSRERRDSQAEVGREYERVKWPKRAEAVHSETVKFLQDLKAAEEATRNHSIHFGPNREADHD